MGIFPRAEWTRTSPRQWRGETVNRYIPGRRIPVLAQPKSGTALLAIKPAPDILPVALIGTERVYANMLKLRRTPVTIRIGRPFDPLRIDPPCAGVLGDSVSTSCRT